MLLLFKTSPSFKQPEHFITFIKNLNSYFHVCHECSWEVSAGVSVCLPVCVMWLRCVCARNGSSHLTCPTHTGRERECERERERESGKLQLICSWLFFESEVFTMKHKDFISTVGVINDSSVDWQLRLIGLDT